MTGKPKNLFSPTYVQIALLVKSQIGGILIGGFWKGENVHFFTPKTNDTIALTQPHSAIRALGEIVGFGG